MQIILHLFKKHGIYYSFDTVNLPSCIWISLKCLMLGILYKPSIAKKFFCFHCSARHMWEFLVPWFRIQPDPCAVHSMLRSCVNLSSMYGWSAVIQIVRNKCSPRSAGRKKKRLTSSRVDEFSYRGNECTTGRCERPVWKWIILDKVYLCGLYELTIHWWHMIYPFVTEQKSIFFRIPCDR